MIYVDTGYLLALVQPRDTLHLRAVRWAAVVRERLLLSDYVLLETVDALSIPHDRAKAHVLLKQIRLDPAYEIVSASTELMSTAIELHSQRADKAWSLTDCTSFITMNDRRILRALAHDHHFEQAGFVALLRTDPPS